MDRLFEAYLQSGKDLFLVGGAVRDHLLGCPIEELEDLDFATNASPDQSLKILKQAGISTHEVGKQFGTIGALLPHIKGQDSFLRNCQITTYRSAEYYPRGSRHPDVKFGDNLLDDLRRRDLTINSMAMDIKGEIIDPYGGKEDIDSGYLRSVGDPVERFDEDPLRMLRVARFMSTLGFRADDKLIQACKIKAPEILLISRERWLVEMDKLLLGNQTSLSLTFLLKTGLLNLILPEVKALFGFEESCTVHHKDLWAHTLIVVKQSKNTLIQRWTALIHDVGKTHTRNQSEDTVSFYGHESKSAAMFSEIAARFKMDRDRTRKIEQLIVLHGLVPSYNDSWTDAAIRRLVRRADVHLQGLLDFAEADLSTAIESKRIAALSAVKRLKERIKYMDDQDNLKPRLPRGIGKEIMEKFQLKQGPEVGNKIEALNNACLDGRLPSSPTPSDCIQFLEDET
jgi:poly(A) polymerase